MELVILAPECRNDQKNSRGGFPARAHDVSEYGTALSATTEDQYRSLTPQRSSPPRVRASLLFGLFGLGACRWPTSSAEAQLVLTPLARMLPDSAHKILYLRADLTNTPQQIADVLGMCETHVSRLLGSVYARLREPVEHETIVGPKPSEKLSTA